MPHKPVAGFAERVAARRTHLRISIAEAAARVRMKRTNWEKMERGDYQPTAAVVGRIADVLETTAAQLYGEGGPAEPDTKTSTSDVSLAPFMTNLRARRAQLGLRQTQAADRAGMDPAQWSRIERGVQSPGVKLLTQVARALDTTPSMLLKGVGDDPALGESPEVVNEPDGAWVVYVKPEDIERFRSKGWTVTRSCG